MKRCDQSVADLIIDGVYFQLEPRELKCVEHLIGLKGIAFMRHAAAWIEVVQRRRALRAARVDTPKAKALWLYGVYQQLRRCHGINRKGSYE
jgi:hypothetical protein